MFPNNIFAGEHKVLFPFICVFITSVKRLPKEFRQKRERMTNIDFLVKKAVDLSGKNFYQERMVLMPCTVMNSRMLYFQFRRKPSFCF
jgi:hypothetical protein